MYSLKPISYIEYTPYDVNNNILQESAPKISLTDFVSTAKLTGDYNVISENGDIEFVPHNDHYTSPRQKQELRSAIMSRFGISKPRKRKSNYTKALLKQMRKTGIGIITPSDTSSCKIVSFQDFCSLVNEPNVSQKYPNGFCVESRDLYIPSKALSDTKNKRMKIIDALIHDLNLPTGKNRERILKISHKYGSPLENISGGKYSMIRQVSTKKRLVLSGRCVISSYPLHNNEINIDVIMVPRNMYNAFFQDKNIPFALILATRYPVNTLNHTSIYRAEPWDNDTAGVPNGFLDPQGGDFDGDAIIIKPIQDYESAIHSYILGNPYRFIFTGTDFTTKPSPHTIICSNITKREYWNLMFETYVFYSIIGKLDEYMKWYKTFEQKNIQRIDILPQVSFNAYIRGNITLRRIIESEATRMNQNTMLQVTNSIGVLDSGKTINDNLLLGISFNNLFSVFSQGRKSVVEGKCNIGNEGKKQNIIQYSIGDLIVQYDYSLCTNDKNVIEKWFINALPNVYKLPQGSLYLILNEFQKYLNA